MTHSLGALERLRQFMAGALHSPLSTVGLYAERSVPYPDLEATFHRLGFVRNLVSSLKTREYATPPEVSVASWAWCPDGAVWSDSQLHLSLYTGPDETMTDVYAHWKPS